MEVLLVRLLEVRSWPKHLLLLLMEGLPSERRSTSSTASSEATTTSRKSIGISLLIMNIVHHLLRQLRIEPHRVLLHVVDGDRFEVVSHAVFLRRLGHLLNTTVPLFVRQLIEVQVGLSSEGTRECE